MTNLQLILSDSFNAQPVNVYRDIEGHELLTRQQIADMLGVSVNSIDQMHSRYRERFDRFSVTDNLSGTDGKQYRTYLYTFKGVLEIARRSNSSIADAVIDFVWDLADKIRKGEIPAVSPELERLREENSVLRMKTQILEEHTESEPLDYDEVASMLSEYMPPPFGRNHLKRWLIDRKILCVQAFKNDKPIQSYIDRGWFVAVIHEWFRRGKKHSENRFYMTPRGVMGVIDMAIREKLLTLPAPKQACLPGLYRGA